MRPENSSSVVIGSSAVTASIVDGGDLDLLYREHAGVVLRFIERLTGTGAHADDLLQETFICAFKSRHRYDGRSARSWLYGIAANLCRRHRRSLFRFERLKTRVLLAPKAPGDLADEMLERRERAALVHQALASLPFKQREVFVLYELEGLEGAAIAELVGIPVGTVWTRLHHARKRFTDRIRRLVGQEKNS